MKNAWLTFCSRVSNFPVTGNAKLLILQRLDRESETHGDW